MTNNSSINVMPAIIIATMVKESDNNITYNDPGPNE